MNAAGPVSLFLFRHGETEWALSGRHTGRTDIPLTQKGEEQAAQLSKITHEIDFSHVLSSPLSRALNTAKLAGFGATVEACSDLAELNYGDYEGLTTAQIRTSLPDWSVWTHPCVGGESLEQAAARTTRVISFARTFSGNVALFAHGHILRILAATWLNLPPTEGRHLMLNTGTISILGHERETPAIKIWNAPLDVVAMLSSNQS